MSLVQEMWVLSQALLKLQSQHLESRMSKHVRSLRLEMEKNM